MLINLLNLLNIRRDAVNDHYNTAFIIILCSVHIRNYFWSVFSCIWTEVNYRIQSKYRKIRKRKNSVFVHFYAVWPSEQNGNIINSEFT